MRYALGSLALLVAIVLCSVTSLARYQLRQVATMSQPPAGLDDFPMLKLMGGDVLEAAVAPGAPAGSPAELAKQIDRRCLVGFATGLVVGAVGLTVVLMPGKGDDRSE